MNKLARRCARWIWYWILTLGPRSFSNPKYDHLRAQGIRRHKLADLPPGEAFARRHAVKILTVVFNVAFAYTAVVLAYWAVVNLQANGFLSLPDSVAQRTGQSDR